MIVVVDVAFGGPLRVSRGFGRCFCPCGKRKAQAEKNEKTKNEFISLKHHLENIMFIAKKWTMNFIFHSEYSMLEYKKQVNLNFFSENCSISKKLCIFRNVLRTEF